jgi:hypothetical protein
MKPAFRPVRLDAGPEPSAAHLLSRTVHGRRQLRDERLLSVIEYPLVGLKGRETYW